MKRTLGVSVLAGVLALICRRSDAQGLGAGAGVVRIEDGGSSLFLTASMRVKLFGPILLEPEVGYWKKSEAGLGGEVSADDLSVGGNVLVVVPAHPLELFGGIGAGAHFLDRSAGSAGLLARSEQTKLGLHLMAGLDFVVSDSLNLFGAVRRDTFKDDDVGPVQSQTKIYGGLRFKF